MFKNLLIALLGISLVLMGLAYLQSERGRDYLAEQLRQTTGRTGSTGTATTGAPTPALVSPTTTPPPPASPAPATPAPSATTATTEPPKALDEVALQSEVKKYAAQFRSKVERSWSIPAGSTSGLMCLLKIELQPDGKVQNVSITQSSGDEAFDRSAVAAVKKAAPFPLPEQPEAAARFKSFNFKFNPRS